MKRMICLLALAGPACQQQKQPAQSAALIMPSKHVSAKVAAVLALTTKAKPDSLTAEMRAALREVNISKLFLAPESQSAGSAMALDGFFGTNPQRLSLAIVQASRDSLRPELIHVVGKARDQRRVTSFTGDIYLTRLVDFYNQDLLFSQGEFFPHGESSLIEDTTAGGDGHITNARAYAASATFRFIGSAPASYVLSGEAFLDFWVMNNRTVGTLYSPAQGAVVEKAATKGSGLLLKGNWQDLTLKTVRPFSVSRDVFLLSPSLIADFGIGERNSQVNPKYAKMGWNTYWENDEWWAESPEPKLSL
jgi:hypothetical protein